MLTVLCGSRGRMTGHVLEALLTAQEQRDAQTAYQAQLLWQLNAQLAAWHGITYAMPDYFTLFPVAQPSASAEEIRRHVLRGLAQLDDTTPKEVV